MFCTAIMINEDSTKKVNRRVRLFFSLGLAAFLGLMNSIPLFLENRNSQLSNLWLTFLIMILLGVGFWIATIHFIWFLEKKISFTENKIFKATVVHLLTLILFAFIFALWTSSILFLVNPVVNERYALLPFALFRTFYESPLIITAYAAVLGVGIGLNYYRKYQERTLRTSQLETQLAQSQLQTLKAQLQPHFLFNTLNGIVGLIRHNENEAAIAIITELSELLRYVTENAGKETVELREELEFNKLYLDLHEKRFPNRLQIEMNIASETLPVRVPNLILQPLIENAVVHGISKSLSARIISVETKISDHRLVVIIRNDGGSLPENWEAKKGVGLGNTFARLEKTYHNDFSLKIENQTGSGVIVNMNLPLEIPNL